MIRHRIFVPRFREGYGMTRFDTHYAEMETGVALAAAGVRVTGKASRGGHVA